MTCLFGLEALSRYSLGFAAYLAIFILAATPVQAERVPIRLTHGPMHGIGHRTPTYETLNRDWADRVHFHIMNGDWLYEERPEYPPEAWRLIQGVDAFPLSVQVMPTIVGAFHDSSHRSRGCRSGRPEQRRSVDR